MLDVIGNHDSDFCAPDAVDCSSAASVRQAEAPYYSSTAQLQIVVIPATGHALNLHVTVPLWYSIALGWTRQHFPPA